MEALTFAMGIVAAISVGLVIWSNTKSGKRWIENL